MRTRISIFFIAMLTLLFSVATVHAVDVDSCQTISSSGEYTLNSSITFNGTCFVISANNVVLDGAGFTMTGNESHIAISASSVNNVTVKDFALINNSDTTIQFAQVTNSSILNNTLRPSNYSNGRGILLYTVNNTRVDNNTIEPIRNNALTIAITGGSWSNTISNNTLSSINAVSLVFLDDASNNTVSSNTLNLSKTSTTAIYVDADPGPTSNNIIESNTLTTLELAFRTKGNGTIFRYNNITCNGNNTCIEVRGNSHSSKLYNNTINANDIGIKIEQSSYNNNVSDNTINSGMGGNSGYAVHISSVNSTNNTVYQNTISTITPLSRAIILQSENNTVSSNTITTQGNQSYGIHVSSVNRNTITSNTINTTNLSESHGILISSANFTTISSNTVTTWGTVANAIGLSGESRNTTITSNTATSHNDTAVYIDTSSHYATVSGNTISANATDAEAGISLNSNFSTIISNTITGQSVTVYGISLGSISSNNQLINNNITALNDSLSDSSAGDNSLIYNNSFGKINWTKSSISSNINLSIGSTVFLSSNLVGLVDQESESNLNASAEIKFFSLGYNSTVYLFKNGVRCDNSSSLCNTSYDASTGILTANVSSFSNYTTTGDDMNITVNSPEDNSWQKDSITLNVTVARTLGTDAVTNVTYILFNSSGSNVSSVTNLSNSTGNWVLSLNTSSLDDGNHSIEFNATDGTFSNLKNVTIKVDNTDPVVSSISSSASSSSAGTVTVNATDATSEIANCTYSGSGNGTLTNSSEIYSVSLSGLSASTSYTISVVCSDNAGNSITNTTSFTTSAASSSSSSGGAGGASGGVSSTSTTYAKKVWTSINEGEKATVDLSDTETSLTEIEFSIAKTIYGVVLEVEKLSKAPSQTSTFSYEAYRYLDIDEKNLQKGLDGDVTIQFKVEKEWLSEKGVSEENVALFRYTGGEWDLLETVQSKKDSEFVYYSATTPGFSYFLIGQKGEESETVSEPVSEEITKDSEDEGEMQEQDVMEESAKESSLAWLWVVLSLAVIGIALYFYFRKK